MEYLHACASFLTVIRMWLSIAQAQAAKRCTRQARVGTTLELWVRLAEAVYQARHTHSLYCMLHQSSTPCAQTGSQATKLIIYTTIASTYEICGHPVAPIAVAIGRSMYKLSLLLLSPSIRYTAHSLRFQPVELFVYQVWTNTWPNSM